MKIDIKIPCFPGFYCGWYDYCELVSCEVENDETAALYACRDDWDFAPGWRDGLARLYAERYSELVRDELGVPFDVESIDIWSPRYYNYTTDQLTAAVEVGDYATFAAALLEKVMQPANREYIASKIHADRGEYLDKWIEAVRKGEGVHELDGMIYYLLCAAVFGGDSEHEYLTLPALDDAYSDGLFELVPTSDTLRAEIERVEKYGDMWFDWVSAHDLTAKSSSAFWASVAKFDEYVEKWSDSVSLNERLKYNNEWRAYCAGLPTLPGL